MFYTETITIPQKKTSLFERVIRAFERSGYLRAEAELKRLGYIDEAKRVRERINNL